MSGGNSALLPGLPAIVHWQSLLQWGFNEFPASKLPQFILVPLNLNPPREILRTLGFLGNKINRFPRDQSLSVYYSTLNWSAHFVSFHVQSVQLCYNKIGYTCRYQESHSVVIYIPLANLTNIMRIFFPHKTSGGTPRRH